MVRHGWLGVAGAAAVTTACGSLPLTQALPERQPRLVWEGEGAAREERAGDAARGLAPIAPGVRRGLWGEGADATYQLLEAESSEPPHVHARHDLTVVVLRGHGTLFVEDRRLDVAAGDVLQIGRGRVHHFHPAAGTAVLALVIYTPRLENPDYVLSERP